MPWFCTPQNLELQLGKPSNQPGRRSFENGHLLGAHCSLAAAFSPSPPRASQYASQTSEKSNLWINAWCWTQSYAVRVAKLTHGRVSRRVVFDVHTCYETRPPYYYGTLLLSILSMEFCNLDANLKIAACHFNLPTKLNINLRGSKTVIYPFCINEPRPCLALIPPVSVAAAARLQVVGRRIP